LEANGAYDLEDDDEDDEINNEEKILHDAIKGKQIISRHMSHETKTRLPRKILLRGRTQLEMRTQLESVGLESVGVIENSLGKKRSRSTVNHDFDDMDVEENDEKSMHIDNEPVVSSKTKNSKITKRARTQVIQTPTTMQEVKRNRSKPQMSTRIRSQSATAGTKEGSVAPRQLKQISKSKMSMEVQIYHYARGGEADRRTYPKLVKHMNSGKKSLGTSTIGR
jgi:hypothetical protein